MKLILAGLLLLTACTSAPVESSSDTASYTPVDTPSPTAPATATSKVSMTTFVKVQSGMTLQEVEAFLGKGTLASESEVMDIKTSVYTWQNGMSNITLTLQDGKVINKAQSGL